MGVFARLAQQISGTELPLYAVTLTAVPHPDTPVLLMFHWHGFRRSPTLISPSLAPPIRSIPGSAVQLNERWHDLGALEAAMLDAALQLGAWDVERVQRRGCNDVAARSREAHECRQAFGVTVEAPEHEIGIVDEAPDRAELMALRWRRGDIRWLFRPVHGGFNEAPYDPWKRTGVVRRPVRCSPRRPLAGPAVLARTALATCSDWGVAAASL